MTDDWCEVEFLRMTARYDPWHVIDVRNCLPHHAHTHTHREREREREIKSNSMK